MINKIRFYQAAKMTTSTARTKARSSPAPSYISHSFVSTIEHQTTSKDTSCSRSTSSGASSSKDAPIDDKDVVQLQNAARIVRLESSSNGTTWNVAVGGEQDASDVQGGGVAACRLSPECVFFIENGRETLLDEYSSCRRRSASSTRTSEQAVLLELGAGHGCLGAWAAALLSTTEKLEDDLEVLEDHQVEDSSSSTRAGSSPACSSPASLPASSSSSSPRDSWLQPPSTACPPSPGTTTSRPLVFLTDLPDFLFRAETTIAANAPTRASGGLQAFPLPFGETEAVVKWFQHVGGDQPPRVVLLGAGITYWECLFEPLIATLGDFFDRAGPGSCALLSYFRRNWSLEKRFWTKLLVKRFHVEVVAEGKVDDDGVVVDDQEDGGNVGRQTNTTPRTRRVRDQRLYAPTCTRDNETAEWNLRLYKVTPKENQNRGGEQPEQKNQGTRGGENGQFGSSTTSGTLPIGATAFSKADKKAQDALAAKIAREAAKEQKAAEAKDKKGKNKKKK
ncbi:unnamed protein product [Amoebophrya sp. A25]|nr:unnamed protein product [Amoebophrya sp. A25]|eukprot:GSA25T00008439001.1